MLLEDMNWMDVERYLQRDNRLVIITGACEQHAYLSLLADVRLPLAIAKRAAEAEDVLIAPPLPYGVSPYFIEYPGSLSLRPETFARLVREIAEGYLRQGFRRLLFSNGHGGNSGVLTPVLIELNSQYPEAVFRFYQWWTEAAVMAVAQEAGLPQYHANWQENTPQTRVASSVHTPQGSKALSEPPPRVASARRFRQVLGDGSFGGPYQAPQAVLDQMMEAAVAAMVRELQAL